MDPATRHDASRRLAYRLVEIIAPCLRPDEQLEALREFYAAIHASLEEYEKKFDDSLK
jgi:hypothetical protein